MIRIRPSQSTHLRAFIAFALLALITIVGRADAQSAGTIRGTVVDATSGAFLPDVQVSIVGTHLGAITNESGRYTITSVPRGRQTVRAQKLGYAQMQSAATLAGSNTATIDFRMATVALSLSTRSSSPGLPVPPRNACSAIPWQPSMRHR